MSREISDPPRFLAQNQRPPHFSYKISDPPRNIQPPVGLNDASLSDVFIAMQEYDRYTINCHPFQCRDALRVSDVWDEGLLFHIVCTCLTLAVPRGGQSKPPPKVFFTAYQFVRFDHHHFHRHFLKYCFATFF